MKGFLLYGLLLSVTLSFAQGPNPVIEPPKEQPKIGLVLSGGGARGFAHLGVLKVLEEVGIKPDIITGTSMGSIVGGLYALGLSTDQVADAASSADWGAIMSNEVSFDNISFEEKMFYNRWITDFREVEGKFVLRSGLIAGQEHQMYLSRFTRTGHYHDKFTEFPIPYACVAADIASGEAWKMDSGNVVTAIRASMAIPSIFTPVERDNRLLVDGGIVRNMPVQEAIDMGADIIISVFVGSDLEPKEKLLTAADILEQSAFILSAYDTKKQKSLSDIFIRPDFRELTNMDFEESERFFEYGEEAARKQIDELRELAVKIYGESVPFKRPDLDMPETYTINQISVKGLDRITKNFVMSKLEMEMDQPYSLAQIEKSVRQLYGTLYFEKVTYNIKQFPSGTTELALEVEEVSPAKIKVAMFYNSETLAGISLNFTRRNGLVRNSRAVLEVAFAENPRGVAQYFKYLGRDQRFAASGGVDFQTIHDFVWLNLQGGETRYSYTHSGAFLGVQETGSLKRSYGLMVHGNYTRLTPRVNADTILSRYHEQSLFTSAWYAYNSLNRVYFPSKGWKGRLTARGTLTASRKFSLQDGKNYWEDLTADREKMEFIALIEGRVINYAPVNKSISIVSGASLSMHASGEAILSGSAKLGGIRPVLPGGVSFWGEDPNGFINKDLLNLHVGAQWNITGSWFLEGRVNYANPTYPMIWLIDHKNEDQFNHVDGSWDDLWGGGVMLNYMSAVGPLSFGYHQSNRGSSAEWFLQLGFSL